MKKQRYKTVFISDIHLGTRGCKAQPLVDFLDSFQCDTLYLIGDIIDAWSMSRGNGYFPQEHVNVIRKILSKAKSGTKIIYIIGNHDEFLRSFCDFFEGQAFGNIHFANEKIHKDKHGKKFLVVHGDCYDAVTRCHRWLSVLGDLSYVTLLQINTLFNLGRAKLGYPYWSLSAYIKYNVKRAVEFISDYENSLCAECERRNLDGVICGHIHTAEIRQINDIVYMNTGDWVESCTAIIEHDDGSFHLEEYYKVEIPKKDKKVVAKSLEV